VKIMLVSTPLFLTILDLEINEGKIKELNVSPGQVSPKVRNEISDLLR
jgi:hypothetical protein